MQEQQPHRLPPPRPEQDIIGQIEDELQYEDEEEGVDTEKEPLGDAFDVRVALGFVVDVGVGPAGEKGDGGSAILVGRWC